MNRCSLCLSQIADGAATCATCGAHVGPTAAQPADIAKKPTAHRRDVALIAVAAAAAAMVTFLVLVWRGGASPTVSAASPEAAAIEHPSSAAALPAVTATQTWSAENRALWLGYRRGAAFQLLAENTVHTYFGPTQPVLVVRCESRSIEAFVYIRSPARIEPNAEGKTVKVSVDDEPAKTESWSDSDDRVALFAPDGAAFARRLLHAQTLRFGYSPHNADDVVAQFHVSGLAHVLEPAARECGLKQ